MTRMEGGGNENGPKRPQMCRLVISKSFPSIFFDTN